MNLKDFLTPTQKQLAKKIIDMFTPLVHPDEIVTMENGFVLIKGQAPILLVAHLDTVHKTPVKDIFYSEDKNKMISPQGIGGDDRCGVYGICKIWHSERIKPWLLFTFDEEIGCIGAQKFVRYNQKNPIPKNALKCIIQIDRRGSNDAVFYDCDNPDFTSYILSKGFTLKQGSFSDISVIAPALNIAAANVSAGYYNEHTTSEMIVLSELEATIEKVAQIVNESVSDTFPSFEYIPSTLQIFQGYNDLFTFENDIHGELEEIIDFLYDFYMDDQVILNQLDVYTLEPISYFDEIQNLYETAMDYIDANYDAFHDDAFTN